LLRGLVISKVSVIFELFLYFFLGSFFLIELGREASIIFLNEDFLSADGDRLLLLLTFVFSCRIMFPLDPKAPPKPLGA
jgi:hypothetical protein